MKLYLAKFYAFLSRPILPHSRLVLALLTVPLLLSLWFPLWKISMEAPQYPQGLSMDIYAYKIVGGNEGHDIQEINTLNHYIGMRKLDQRAFADLDFLPFFLGALALLTLRAVSYTHLKAMTGMTTRDLISMEMGSVMFPMSYGA